MRKFLCIGLIMSLSFSLCACWQNSNITSSITDKTVIDENIVEVVGIDEKDIIEDNVECCDYAISSELSSIIDNSEEIIKGTVNKVTYVVYQGIAWTKVDIVVNESLSGELKVNDCISVYKRGGYISLEDHIKKYNDEEKFKLSELEIKDKLIKSIVENEESPIVSDQSIFFLKKTSAGAPFPEGAYERVLGKNAELKFNKSNNMFERDDINENSKNKEKFKLEEVKEKVKENIERKAV